MMPIPHYGLDMANTEVLAQKLGLRLAQKKSTELSGKNICLAKYLNGNHVILLNNPNGNNVLVHDPRRGIFSLKKDQIAQIFEELMFEITQKKEVSPDELLKNGEMTFYKINQPAKFIRERIQKIDQTHAVDTQTIDEFLIYNNRSQKYGTIPDEGNIKGVGVDLLKSIHRNLFPQDAAAGTWRQFISSRGGFFFALPDYIESCVLNFFDIFPQPSEFAKADKTDVAQNIALYISDLNAIHPFKNGNGRTIKIFFRKHLALGGIDLDLNKVSKSEDYHAFYHAKIGYPEYLISLVASSLSFSKYTASEEKGCLDGRFYYHKEYVNENPA